ncbi:MULTISPECIES: hypothetical protein [unclassified Streptosporangium]|uniref:hypothetical protein n=1 Tax=unclassified Streptosporangium TaxID=2632669 RepID=UPI002E2E3D21|nr:MULTISPECIES: hypothetical protein [unclassified Streptosporangium]
MDEILRAAGEVVGVELSDPVDLGGNPRSVVLRCRTASGGSVVVKRFGSEPDGLRAFAAEAAGLSLRLAGPELLGVDASVPLVVMEDLGSAPTLADVLLGDDPRAALDGLSAWARGLGLLAVESVRRRDDLASLSARHGRSVPSWDEDPWAVRCAAEFPSALAGIGVEAPPELAGELGRIVTTGADEYLAFTPGDTCPDNNLLTPDGLRLIDFESACYQPVFMTAAYCRMPFATCWCVFTLPAGLAEKIEETYRAEVVEAYPELVEDEIWRPGVRRAVALWTVYMTTNLIPRTAKDGPAHRTRRPVPTLRQLLRHRWEMASTLEEFPAFAETMRLLLREVADGWDVPPLPGYPAFGG